MFLIVFLFYWWLDNPGQEYFNGLEHEDINWSGHKYVSMYTGKGITINVMSDGALFEHNSYKDRAIEDQFISIMDDEPYLSPSDPKNNHIATASLGLAAGKPVDNFTGIAPNASVASYYFTDYSGRTEHLQTVACHRSREWHIALLQYLRTNCYGRWCRYIEPETFPKEILDDCLYKPEEDNWQHPIVVPLDVDGTSDPLFSPPGRWPMVFSIVGVNNRGVPLNHGAEGVSAFLACPCADNAALPTASSMGKEIEYSNFTSPNASASIFAGALAVLMEANSNLTVADLFYITAMTADKTMPDSLNWDVNGFGLNFNRRTGFGRLNLGRAVDLALNFESCGKFYDWGQRRDLNLVLDKGDYNITFVVDDPEVQSVASVLLKLKAQRLSFGSLNPHIISPSGTRCEMKILTEGDLDLNIESMEFASYKFLGENPQGTWTLIFKETDDANRGTILKASLHIYYTKKRPRGDQINQRIAANPFSPGPDKIQFPGEVEPVKFVAGTKFTINVSVPEENRKVLYLVYLEDESGKRRVKIKMYYNSDFTKMTLSYVPSVFKTGLPMNLVIESIDPHFGYTSKLKLDYENPFTPGIISPKDGSIIPTDQLDIPVQYALDLDYISDDGYSTSVAMTVLSSNSKVILDRAWMRNLGKETYRNAVPDRSFLFQISPSSSDRFEQFSPMTVHVTVSESRGKYAPLPLVYDLKLIIMLSVLLAVALILLIFRIFYLCKEKSIRVENNKSIYELANQA